MAVKLNGGGVKVEDKGCDEEYRPTCYRQCGKVKITCRRRSHISTTFAQSPVGPSGRWRLAAPLAAIQALELPPDTAWEADARGRTPWTSTTVPDAHVCLENKLNQN